MKGRNIEDVESHLHEISHPKPANCGSEDVVRIFARDETADIFLGWLIASGVAEVVVIGRSRGGSKRMQTAEEAEQLMNEYNGYWRKGRDWLTCKVS